jgi:cytochrome c biogenesis protein CcdA
MMTGNRLMQQVIAIFSVFMVFFYLGVGWYLIFRFNLSNLDKAVRVIIGSTFMFYGLYRAFRTYGKIVEVFFTKDEDDE